MNRRTAFLLVAMAALAIFAAVITVNSNSEDSTGPPVSLQDADQIAHVHGLGVNPGDGAVYVATHYGLYRLDPARKGHRVGDIQQDTMGFTIVGADDFLASGHPDLKYERRTADRRPFLGLVESRDRGRTWQELSLAGQADFHGLVAAHGLVYGWSSNTGAFMVSSDRRTWDERSTVPMISFAVDPAHRDHVVASGERGLLRSRDGGRSWQQEPAGPANAFLSWGSDRDVWSARFEDGEMATSTDAGATWRPLPKLPGRAEALLRHGRDLYVAVASVGILRSTDDGRTWSIIYDARAAG